METVCFTVCATEPLRNAHANSGITGLYSLSVPCCQE